MRCISCEVEINPKWAHAIEQNICPFCGAQIMDDNLKESLSSLKNIMSGLSHYNEQLDDWLLYNFNYIKVDSPDLINYVDKDVISEFFNNLKKSASDQSFNDRKKHIVKVKTELGEEDVEVEKTQSIEDTNSFFDRAEVKKNKFSSVSEKTEHLKALKKQIEETGSSSVINESGLSDMIESELNDVDSGDYQSLVSGNEISSSLPDIGDGDEIPSVVLAMEKRSNSKNNSNADFEKLKAMRDRTNASKNNFSKAKGSFTR